MIRRSMKIIDIEEVHEIVEPVSDSPITRTYYRVNRSFFGCKLKRRLVVRTNQGYSSKYTWVSDGKHLTVKHVSQIVALNDFKINP